MLSRHKDPETLAFCARWRAQAVALFGTLDRAAQHYALALDEALDRWAGDPYPQHAAGNRLRLWDAWKASVLCSEAATIAVLRWDYP